MKSLFLIPARGGSKGIPHKNIKLLGGKPLIQYSIEVARELTTDENICVSTDDAEIVQTVEKLGLQVPFMRPAELATDTATTSDVIIHALNWYEKGGIKYDNVVLLQPTSPLRTANHIKDCLDIYSDEIDMVVSVKESSVSAVLCHEDTDGYLKMTFGKTEVRHQDSARMFEYNGAVYVINAKSILRSGWAGLKKIKKYIMSDVCSVDIDTMLDWTIVETIMNENNYDEIQSVMAAAKNTGGGIIER